MTANQFKAALAKVGLSQLGAARFFGLGDRTVRRLAAGEYLVPPAISYCLRLMIDCGRSPQDLDPKFKG